MARADLLLSLVRAASKNDSGMLRRTVEALIAEERGKQHHVLADRLEEALSLDGMQTIGSGGPLSKQSEPSPALIEIRPERSISDLVLPEDVVSAFDVLVEEHLRADLLRSHNLEPRNRILVAGPPGNGKTSLAEALAHALMLPLFVVRYESLIASYLGETASRLRLLFDFVRTRECVLFFDEFDTLGKERGDIHETGEIKRVVSSLLLQIDSLPSYVVVVVATNHPELLDRAVWRRFQSRWRLPPPTLRQRIEWFARFQQTHGLDLGYQPRTLADRLGPLSFSDLEEFTTGLLRRQVLAGEESARHVASQQLQEWSKRFTLEARVRRR